MRYHETCAAEKFAWPALPPRPLADTKRFSRDAGLAHRQPQPVLRFLRKVVSACPLLPPQSGAFPVERQPAFARYRQSARTRIVAEVQPGGHLLPPKRRDQSTQ